ncbi:MAG: UDP-2,3-diacylglucosamine diphosphatase [Bacteroidota bacterium]
MKEGRKIYFASDFHLGVPGYEKSLEREKRIVRWLDEIRHDAEEIFLLGDMFDFWFEYRHSVPKGYVRLLGKLAEISDSGIPLHIFSGNHDMWMFGYLPREINAKLYRQPITREFNGKKFFIGHGDGLGPGDRGYKFIKAVFASWVCQWLFARFHPNFGLWLGNYLSKRSRVANGESDEQFNGPEKEWLYIFAREKLKQEHFDYFIFGHRHLPLDLQVSENSRYINTGEWIKSNSYAVFDGKELQLKYYR